MGWNVPRSSTRWATSAVCPSTVPDSRQPIWMIRAKEWASGRNSSADRPRPGEDVRQRADRVPHVGQQVQVAELAALGPAGGPRGVDDGGQVRGLPGCAPPGQFVVADPGAVGGQAVQLRGLALGIRALDQPDPFHAGQPGQHLAVGLQVGRGLHDQRAGAGVAQDPFHLLGGGRLVDRHGDRAGRPDGVVGHRPLVPGPGQQGDPVAGADAGRDQALGQRGHVGAELGRGHVLPGCAGRRVLAPDRHRRGSRSARSKTTSASFAAGEISATAGLLYSRMPAPAGQIHRRTTWTVPRYRLSSY